MSTRDNYEHGSLKQSRNQHRSGKNHKARKPIKALLVIFLMLFVAAGVSIFALMNSNGDEGSPLGLINPPDDEKFYDGVFVDDISLGGLGREVAKQQIEAKQNTYVQNTGVTVTYNGQNWNFMIADTAYAYDTDAVLDEAFKHGREGTYYERRDYIDQLPQNPVMLRTTIISCDPSALESQVRDLAAQFYKAPVDAVYKGHDTSLPDGEHMQYASEVPGEQVDADVLWAAVKKEFTEQTCGTVQIEVVPVEAEVKVADLKAKMDQVVSFRSPILDHTAPRLTNIELSSAAVNEKLLQPGDEVSFNDTTGERTEAKGYQVAGIINSGVPDTGLGGGVCQVSGTLWNAVVRADLEIVNRLNHSLKSSYLDPGEDATVDYGRKDLVFKNNRDTPVMVFMYIDKEDDKYWLYAEIYGVPLEPGVTIELESVRSKTSPAPQGEPRYVASNKVPRGKTETVKAKRGEYYTTYKLYLKDGKETNRLKLHESYYPSSVKTIMYNPADGKPTPTPSPTPTPTPTPKQTPKETPVPTLPDKTTESPSEDPGDSVG